MIPTSQFSHVAATFDGTAARIFVNGVEERALSLSGTLASSAAPVIIGNAGAETRACFPNQVEFVGLIDEVTIYNRALAASEIQGLFNAGSAGKCPAPRLFIQRSVGTAIISWSPAMSGFALEETMSLVSPSWSPSASGNPTAPFPVSGEAKFYRLRRQ